MQKNRWISVRVEIYEPGYADVFATLWNGTHALSTTTGKYAVNMAQLTHDDLKRVHESVGKALFELLF